MEINVVTWQFLPCCMPYCGVLRNPKPLPSFSELRIQCCCCAVLVLRLSSSFWLGAASNCAFAAAAAAVRDRGCTPATCNSRTGYSVCRGDDADRGRGRRVGCVWHLCRAQPTRDIPPTRHPATVSARLGHRSLRPEPETVETRLDCSRLTQLLGRCPETRLRDGLRQCLPFRARHRVSGTQFRVP